MLKEVLEYLDPQPGQYFIDCTLGGAGYTMAIAERVGPEGKVVAIDLDKMAIENCRLKIEDCRLANVILIQDNFKNLSAIIKRHFEKQKFNGIVFDLGLSSAQLQDRSRGFSFQQDAPLDMAFGCQVSPQPNKFGAGQAGVRPRPAPLTGAGCQTTEYIVNYWKQAELEKIIREYGEERFARRIAQGIVGFRKIKQIKTTGQLVEIIKSAVPTRLARSSKREKYLYSKIHPATRTFQALRIATNNELDNLLEALPQAVDLLINPSFAPSSATVPACRQEATEGEKATEGKGGRVAVISYHSLEDRIVKHFFKEESRDCICPPSCPACRCQHKARLKILTKKVIMAAEEEIHDNPRARSAKLRVAEKI